MTDEEKLQFVLKRLEEVTNETPSITAQQFRDGFIKQKATESEQQLAQRINSAFSKINTNSASSVNEEDRLDAFVQGVWQNEILQVYRSQCYRDLATQAALATPSVQHFEEVVKAATKFADWARRTKASGKKPIQERLTPGPACGVCSRRGHATSDCFYR